MYNNILLSLAVTVIPFLTITFVAIVLLHKIYFKIRSNYEAKVNCWFCNHNTKVPFLDRNSWTCPECEQYNGFTKDGDYNREIFEQLDCSNLSSNSRKNGLNHSNDSFGQRNNIWSPPPAPPSNGFCDTCNEAQRLKIEKIAQFEPKNESRFDEELKAYKEKLEDQYRLCETCNRHLTRVLREKKRMIIGSKFLEFIMRGAKRLKEPYLIKIRQHVHEQRKQRLNRFALFLTVICFLCLLRHAPIVKKEQVTNLFGENCGKALYIVISHVYAFGRVLMVYMESLLEYDFITKSKLFLQTLSMMVMYSLGLRLPQTMQISFNSIFLEAYPFAMLGLSLFHNILDSLKLTRFTYLLISWSAFAGGLLNKQDYIDNKALMFLNTLLTLVMTLTAKYLPSPKLHDSSSNFHKIATEDYLSDEDTISLLSEQLNSSNASNKSSYNMNNSFMRSPNIGLQKSPITSSTYSLNSFARKKPSPNSSFQRSFQNEANQHPMELGCDASLYNYQRQQPVFPPRNSLFASSLELNRSQRPSSTLPHNNSFLNKSFASAQKADPLNSSFGFPKSHTNESFYSAASAQRNPSQRTFFAAPSLVSPLSFSSNALYQQDKERASNLLTPSRFSTNNLTNNHSNMNSWNFDDPLKSQNSLYNTANPYKNKNVFGMKDLEENLSRTSSTSSGFESQNDQVIFSRENSCLPETNDVLQRTFTVENPMSFQPVPSQQDLTFLAQNSLNQTTEPPAMSITNNSLNGSCSFYQRRNGSSAFRDTFNLNKINEELPSLRRGDLLRKWQEAQNLS